MSSSTVSYALECHKVSRHYPGVIALDGVDFSVLPGEIHALVGENGAGKSTLVKIIAGQQAPAAGEIRVHGTQVHRFTPQQARILGISMVPQHPDLFHSLTALENLFVGDWPCQVPGVVNWTQMRKLAQGVLDELEIELDLNAPVESLSVADRQMLQIARAILSMSREEQAGASPLLILDEPTAPLDQAETMRLFSLLRRLHQRGVAIIYITHRLAEVFKLADRLTVLRDGRLVGTHDVAAVTREQLISLMVGEATAETQAEAVAAPAVEVKPRLEIKNLGVSGKFANVSFNLKPGEIVGIAGVAGSGRSDVLRCLGGALPPTAGTVLLNTTPVTPDSPRRMADLQVAYVPADRHNEALVLPMTLRENVTLGVLKQFATRIGLIKPEAEKSAAKNFIQQLQVRTSSLEQVVETLSGGNQQKVALASRLVMQPQVLLLEEPTQGVDVGARAEIHRQIRQLSKAGVSILLVSSDLVELLALSHRLLVMHRGELVGELTGEDMTQQRALDLALGTAEENKAQAQKTVKRRPLREVGLLTLLVVLFGIISLIAPNFANSENIRDILVNNSYLLIAASGMTLVILTAGIDISIGSMLAVAATCAGAAAAAGWPIYGILLAALGSAAILGSLNASLVTFLRIPPIIATLATLTIFRNVLIHLTGGRWINLPAGFREVSQSTPLGVPFAVWVALVTTLFMVWFARSTVLGRSIYALGSNAQAAANLGIRPRQIEFAVYLIMGLLTGLAAFVYAGRWSAIQTNAGIGFEMLIITAVVVGGTSVFGGRGSIIGTVLGVFLLGIITASLTPLHINPTWERAFQGALILAAVVTDALRNRRGGEVA